MTIPKTAKEFSAWRTANYAVHSLAQLHQAEVVGLSFKTLALNKGNPAALAKAQELHDADMAKLEAMFGSQLSE